MGTSCPCPCCKYDNKKRKNKIPSSENKNKDRVNKQRNKVKDKGKNEDKETERGINDISFDNDNNIPNSNIEEKPVKNNKTTKKTPKIEPKKLDFPPGEHYYPLIKDSNKSELIKKDDNLSEKVELFFSLKDAKNPNDEHSFLISIIKS